MFLLRRFTPCNPLGRLLSQAQNDKQSVIARLEEVNAWQSTKISSFALIFALILSKFVNSCIQKREFLPHFK